MSEERKHVLDIDIAAPRDLVWKAITEGAEIMKWFAPEARVEPGVGGSILLSWGPGMEGKAPITIWEPGQRFGWLDHGSNSSWAEWRMKRTCTVSPATVKRIRCLPLLCRP